MWPRRPTSIQLHTKHYRKGLGWISRWQLKAGRRGRGLQQVVHKSQYLGMDPANQLSNSTQRFPQFHRMTYLQTTPQTNQWMCTLSSLMQSHSWHPMDPNVYCMPCTHTEGICKSLQTEHAFRGTSADHNCQLNSAQLGKIQPWTLQGIALGKINKRFLACGLALQDSEKAQNPKTSPLEGNIKSGCIYIKVLRDPQNL